LLAGAADALPGSGWPVRLVAVPWPEEAAATFLTGALDLTADDLFDVAFSVFLFEATL